MMESPKKLMMDTVQLSVLVPVPFPVPVPLPVSSPFPLLLSDGFVGVTFSSTVSSTSSVSFEQEDSANKKSNQ